jgi:uncharacterized membrane protein YhaH (DUF805 family)
MDKPATYWMLEPMRKYATFSGRARRAEYWWFYLFTLIVSFVSSIVFAPLYIIFSLAVIIPSLAVGVRRLHDTNRSGWWLLAPIAIMIPTYGAAIFMGVGGALGGIAGSGAAAGAGFGGAVIVLVIGGLAALVLGIMLLVWFCSRGTDGPNRYGPDPLGASDGDLASDFA